MEKIIARIKEYKAKIDDVKVSAKRDITREQFTLLLGGVSSFRITPGISGHMGFNKLYHCETAQDVLLVKEHLERLYAVVDKESLLKACNRQFRSGVDYEQFRTFWAGAPIFDVNELDERGRAVFETQKDVAEPFNELLQEKGFYAWDISECVTLARCAVAAGIISEAEFWEISDHWAKVAQVFYSSFEEYAISLLCGAAYFIYRGDMNAVNKFIDLNMNLLDQLLGEDKLWSTSNWYKPEKREYADLVPVNSGCVITKAALDNEDIRYMVHGIAVEGRPDSGWRFFVGNESKEYMDDSENLVIVGLNTVCNINPSIMAHIYARVGKSYSFADGKWIEED